MLTIHVLPKRLKEFLLTHPLYKSPRLAITHGHHLNGRIIERLSIQSRQQL